VNQQDHLTGTARSDVLPRYSRHIHALWLVRLSKDLQLIGECHKLHRWISFRLLPFIQRIRSDAAYVVYGFRRQLPNNVETRLAPAQTLAGDAILIAIAAGTAALSELEIGFVTGFYA
jgi:hypothetical protein